MTIAVNEPHRIIIVGAGPVGLTAALALVQKNVPVLILEALSEPNPIPRASTFHPPTLTMLGSLGIVDELLARGLRVDRFQYRERSGSVVAQFNLGLLKNDTQYPFRLQCPQHQLSRILLDKLKQHDLAEIRFGQQVTDIREKDGQLQVGVQAGEETAWLPGTFIIGADGARSQVRQSLDIHFEGVTYTQRHLQIVTNFDFKAYIPDLVEVNYIFDPEEFVVMLRSLEAWRISLPLQSDEEDSEALDPKRIQQRLQKIINRPDVDFDVTYSAVYTVHQRVATTFRKGRTLLIGDAAHVNTTMGGMGMNSGIHDAFLLAEPLAGLFHKRINDEALEGWAKLRRNVALEYVRQVTHRLTETMRTSGEENRKRRNQELTAISLDPIQARAYLLRTSMLASLQTEDQV